MPFFRDLSDQSRQAFLAMPMQSRVIAILLVVAIALSFGFLVRGDSKAQTAYLFGDQILSESDMTRFEIAFGQANLKGFSRDGLRIRVPAESRSEFLSALQGSASLPAGLQTHVQQAMDSLSPFSSNMLQKEQISHGKQRDVAAALEDFPDIRMARVTYTEGERKRLSTERQKSAAVMITPQGIEPLTAARKRIIQDYVARSFGMPMDQVTVADVNALGSDGLGDDDPYLQRQRDVEHHKKMQILTQLQYIEGVSVEVRAEIDPTLNTEEYTQTVDAQPTTLESTSREITESSSKPATGGVPGAVPNAIGNRSANLDELAQTSTMKDKTKETKAVAGNKYSRSEIAGLLPTKITATVVVPESYYKKLWQQKKVDDPEAFPDPTLTATVLAKLKGDTTDSIQRLVSGLLSDVAAGADARPQVIVETLADLYVPPIIESKTTERAMAWLANSWQKIALVMLGVFALLVARSAVRGGGGNNAPSEFQEGFGLELPAPPAPVEDEEAEKETMTITGGSLKSDLVSLVEDNPEVAANVIRGWVGEAA